MKELKIIPPYTRVRMWVVDIDQDKEPWDARARGSYNSFFHGSKRRNYTDEFLYSAEPVDEILLELQHIKIEELDQVDSLWDFYKIIGYDYKTKKYHKVESE